ncbi:MAG: hypothetical protein ACMUIG_06980 [Thermoplasmatota archaeon]
MAKRRIVRPEMEEEEEKESKPAFVPPEFDETEFLQTENRNAKMIYLSLAVAVVAGLVSFGLMKLVYLISGDGNLHFMLPVGIPLIFFGLVIYLFRRLGIDISNLDWKKWAENGFMYFATWAAIWIISMNPPFSDFSDPVIGDFIVKTIDHNNEERYYVNVTPTEIMDVSSVEVFTIITDNYRIDDRIFTVYRMVDGSEQTIYRMKNGKVDDIQGVPDYNITVGRVKDNTTFTIERDDSEIIKNSDSWFGNDYGHWKGNLWIISFEDLTGVPETTEFRIEVRVTDRSGNESTLDQYFSYIP